MVKVRRCRYGAKGCVDGEAEFRCVYGDCKCRYGED